VGRCYMRKILHMWLTCQSMAGSLLETDTSRVSRDSTILIAAFACVQLAS